MTLVILLDQYFALNLRIRDEKTRWQYRHAINQFSMFLGRPPTIDDLTDDNIVLYVRWLLTVRGLSDRTAADRQTRLHAFWRWLAKRGLISRWPTTPTLAVADHEPSAWTRDELERLIETCRNYRNSLCGVPLRFWWLAFHLIIWDTGERTSATLSIQWEWIDFATSTLHIPAKYRKGKRKPATYRLTLQTMRVLAQFRRDAGPVFPCGRHKSSFYHRYSRLLKQAGLPTGRDCKPQKMRRTYASWIAALGGDPTRALLHDSPRTTQRHYIDQTIINRPPENHVLWPLVSDE